MFHMPRGTSVDSTLPTCKTLFGLHRAMAGVMIASALLLSTGISQVTQAQTFRTLYSFKGGTDGTAPTRGLVLDSSGNLYGVTTHGGTYGLGTVFKVSASGNETVLYSFKNTGSDGSQPDAPLIIDGSGNLYGTTLYGGGSVNCTGGCGTVFELVNSSGVYTEKVLYSFAGGSDGAEPTAGLVMDAAGNLYGTTSLGGDTSVASVGYGTVFKLDRSGKHTVLYRFTGSDGDNPGGLVMDAAGNLYGTTYHGGVNAPGNVFKLEMSGNETVLHVFTGPDGENPLSLLRDGSGNLYGTTYDGGTQTYGTVFELDTYGNETVLHSFAGSSSDGKYPDEERLIRDAAGNIYGTTIFGGSSSNCTGGCGTVFKVDASGNEKLLYTFMGKDGEFPYGGLVRGSSGNLYGTTSGGGAHGFGTVFKLSPSSCALNVDQIDPRDSFGVLTASVSGSPCQAYLTIQNDRTYWTNFTIHEGGSVTITPLGGKSNLYAKYLLLPPATILPPSAKSVTYQVTFSQPGASLTIFADPSVDFSNAAYYMNSIQAILDLLSFLKVPGVSGALEVGIDSYQQIVEAFAQMPDFAAFGAAMSQNPPNIFAASQDLFRFFTNLGEVETLGSLMANITGGSAVEIVSEMLKLRLGVITDVIRDFINIYQVFWGTTAGSVTITAH